MRARRLNKEVLKRVKLYSIPGGYPRLPLKSMVILQMYRKEKREAWITKNIPRLYDAEDILYYCLS